MDHMQVGAADCAAVRRTIASVGSLILGSGTVLETNIADLMKDDGFSYVLLFYGSNYPSPNSGSYDCDVCDGELRLGKKPVLS